MAEKSVLFKLPGKQVYAPVTRYDDPLRYYYKPVIGRLYVKRIQDGLSMLTPPYNRVLDFGYGSGLLFNTLAEIGQELHGIDILSDAATLTEILNKQNIRAMLKQENILQAGYPDNYFDLIIAFSVFEHIREFGPILKEMRRIMKPGGQLLIGMPAVNRIMPWLFKAIGFNNIDDLHITNHRSVLKSARQYFELKNYKRLPSFLPGRCCLYFNLLLEKQS
jgi:2-polyprenyl-3-methyl-5-hydroxy-6-metoxy-1,4-benzoquinol methylase